MLTRQSQSTDPEGAKGSKRRSPEPGPSASVPTPTAQEKVHTVLGGVYDLGLFVERLRAAFPPMSTDKEDKLNSIDLSNGKQALKILRLVRRLTSAADNHLMIHIRSITRTRTQARTWTGWTCATPSQLVYRRRPQKDFLIERSTTGRRCWTSLPSALSIVHS